MLNTLFLRFDKWQGEMKGRATGSLVSDRMGETNTYALYNLQERGTLFVKHQVKVYEGMIVGENARAVDLDVNPVKEKKLSNMRTTSADEAMRLVPVREMSLERALDCRSRAVAAAALALLVHHWLHSRTRSQCRQLRRG